jgi:hypothetical protein
MAYSLGPITISNTEWEDYSEWWIGKEAVVANLKFQLPQHLRRETKDDHENC